MMRLYTFHEKETILDYFKSSWYHLEVPGKELEWNLPCVHTLNHVQFFATPWTVAHQAPLSVGFKDKHTGAGCHFLFQGIFLTQDSNPCLLCLLHWQADCLPIVPPGKPLNENWAVFYFWFSHLDKSLTFSAIALIQCFSFSLSLSLSFIIISTQLRSI